MPDNLIHSLTVDITLEGNEGNSNERAEGIYKQYIFPSIEDTINQLDEEEIIIDKLTIDVGDIAKEELYSALSEKLKSQLLKYKVAAKEATPLTEVDETKDCLMMDLPPSSTPSCIIQFRNNIQASFTDSHTPYECVQFLQYLYDETTPWQYTESDDFNLLDFQRDILQKILHEERLSEAFFQAIYGNATMIWRLLQIDDIEILIHIVKKIVSLKSYALPAEFQEYESIVQQCISTHSEVISLPPKGKKGYEKETIIGDFGKPTNSKISQENPKGKKHSLNRILDINNIRIVISLLLGVKYDSFFSKESLSIDEKGEGVQERKEFNHWNFSEEILSNDTLSESFFQAIYGNATIIWRLLQIDDIEILIHIVKKIVSLKSYALPAEFQKYESIVQQCISTHSEVISLPQKGKEGYEKETIIGDLGKPTNSDISQENPKGKEHSLNKILDINNIRIVISLLLGVKYDSFFSKESLSIDEKGEGVLSGKEREEAPKEERREREITRKEEEKNSASKAVALEREITVAHERDKEEVEPSTTNKEGSEFEDEKEDSAQFVYSNGKENTDEELSNHEEERVPTGLDRHQGDHTSDELSQQSEHLLRNLLKQAEVDSLSEEAIMASLAQRIHIQNAGLILLHPFLPAFFSRLGLLTEKHHFTSTEAQKRAVHLLRHLTGIEVENPCLPLTLEKVLCGLPLSFPIENDFNITPEEQREAEELLNTICEYWKPLNRSSYQSLQGTFLQRNGTLEYADETWIIRVEGNAFDILLEDLTWEISTIILPWLDPMIYVEWQAE
ncbi:MAG: hypothetical protein J5554_11025 [Paludibacteraceae bacterium]|nr:hypothetical protein [Paludibacteraceae bacterium]